MIIIIILFIVVVVIIIIRVIRRMIFLLATVGVKSKRTQKGNIVARLENKISFKFHHQYYRRLWFYDFHLSTNAYVGQYSSSFFFLNVNILGLLKT